MNLGLIHSAFYYIPLTLLEKQNGFILCCIQRNEETLPSLSKPVPDAGHHTGPASGLDQAVGHLKHYERMNEEIILQQGISYTVIVPADLAYTYLCSHV